MHDACLSGKFGLELRYALPWSPTTELKHLALLPYTNLQPTVQGCRLPTVKMQQVPEKLPQLQVMGIIPAGISVKLNLVVQLSQPSGSAILETGTGSQVQRSCEPQVGSKPAWVGPCLNKGTKKRVGGAWAHSSWWLLAYLEPAMIPNTTEEEEKYMWKWKWTSQIRKLSLCWDCVRIGWYGPEFKSYPSAKAVS